MSDIDVIEPAATAATFKGRTIQIRPLKVGLLPGFARALQPISGTIEAFATGRTALDLAGIFALIANHGENVVEAVSIATGIEAAELNDSTPDELIELAVLVIKVNADFFKGRLTPAILAAVKRVAPASAPPGAGPTP